MLTKLVQYLREAEVVGGEEGGDDGGRVRMPHQIQGRVNWLGARAQIAEGSNYRGQYLKKINQSRVLISRKIKASYI